MILKKLLTSIHHIHINIFPSKNIKIHNISVCICEYISVFSAEVIFMSIGYLNVDSYFYSSIEMSKVNSKRYK